jgi:hypothetical protein
MRIKRSRKMGKLLQVINENNDDVTDLIVQYYGPDHNWHGMTYTPGDLGYESMTIIDYDGNVFCFDKDQNIILKT